MREVLAKGILSSRNGMNIYRGCTHGCIYCDARSECYGMDHKLGRSLDSLSFSLCSIFVPAFLLDTIQDQNFEGK